MQPAAAEELEDAEHLWSCLTALLNGSAAPRRRSREALGVAKIDLGDGDCVDTAAKKDLGAAEQLPTLLTADKETVGQLTLPHGTDAAAVECNRADLGLGGIGESGSSGPLPAPKLKPRAKNSAKQANTDPIGRQPHGGGQHATEPRSAQASCSTTSAGGSIDRETKRVTCDTIILAASSVQQPSAVQQPSISSVLDMSKLTNISRRSTGQQHTVQSHRFPKLYRRSV
eukprot:gnl/TRDRNA2_/TRDRNA2_126893_c1_seq1.p1 gnl/TRDRNA2_/TRDRNA2_126893_c1~~gnl/TRDRNA2_/TRDRNA2_126893_c1_seq1.p1  ORF type:complete len:252 (-),score=45.42 gnl/TRDRNA2_/TRDRNA2_126893_c1_seq1:82-765(-)